MNTTIQIRLKGEDIAEGDPSAPDTCPVARALNTASDDLGGWWEVTAEFLQWHQPNTVGVWSFGTPEKVKRWVENFDAHDGIDRKGWTRWLFGTRFRELRFAITLNNEIVRASTYWTPERFAIRDAELTLAVAKRKAGASA